MTIAAGFKFNGSILFCADRKITTQQVQTHERKIATRDYANGQCGTTFVFAGDVAFARAAIQACEIAIAGLEEFSSIELIQRTIEAALVRFYQEHVYVRPVDWEGVDFDLLIGILLKGQTALFSSTETVLNEVEEYECIGTGAYLARYWVRQFYDSRRWREGAFYFMDPFISLEEVGLIATCALRSVMEYDEACGGGAEFIVVQGDGQLGVHLSASIYDEFPTKLQAAMWRMMIKLSRADDMSAAQRANEAFFDEVRSLTESYQGHFDDLARRLRESVSPSASPSPEPEDAE